MSIIDRFPALPPYYVGFEAEGQHVGLVPGGGPQGMTSPVAYWQSGPGWLLVQPNGR